MQSIISRAALRSLAHLSCALLAPSYRVTCEEHAADWVEDRKGLEVMAYGDGSGFEVAFKGRLWIICAVRRCPSLGAL